MTTWLQNIIQDHCQSLGITEKQSRELAQTLPEVLSKYRLAITLCYLDDAMWQAAQQSVPDVQWQQARALYHAVLQEYQQRK